MKRIALTILIALMTLAGFAQLIDKTHTAKTITVKRVKSEAPKSAVVDFSNTAEPITGTVVYGRIEENGDTTLIVYLPEVDIDLMQRYMQITDTRQGRRLASNVKKVYPYAKLAGAKMQEYDSILATVSEKTERHRLMKQAEKEITDQYTEELKDLTVTQASSSCASSTARRATQPTKWYKSCAARCAPSSTKALRGCGATT
jgi:hypothetical protein